MNIDSVTFWTDSCNNLRYLNNESKRFKVFVSNRIAEIRSVAQPNQWLYCPTALNPSDLATRGMPMPELVKHGNPWIHGLEFLWKSSNH
jgi:hypothetical protein